MFLVQIIHFGTSPAVLANEAVLINAVNYLSSSRGSPVVYAGPKVEDPQAKFIAIAWNDQDTPDELIEQDAYKAFVSGLTDLVGTEPIASYFVDYRIEPKISFEAPVTEVTVAGLNPGKIEDDLAPLLESEAEIFPSIAGGHPPFAWGSIVGTPRKYSIIAGWDSVEVHYAAAQSPPLNAYIPDLISTIAPEWCHVAFTKLI